MILRLLRATYEPTKLAELKEFSSRVSINVFPHYAGCSMAYIAWAEGDWMTLSFWSNREFILSMERSQLYQDTIRAITRGGLFLREPTIQIFEVSEVWNKEMISTLIHSSSSRERP